MKIKQSFIYYVLLLSLVILISSCGVNSPTTTSNQSSTNTNITSPTVSAYMSPVHGNVITSKAIDLLLSQGNLTEKQKQILLLYRDKIEAGAISEDVLPRPKNHFLDPMRNTPLTDFGAVEGNYNNQTAKDWFLNGDSFMLESGKTKFKQGIPFFDSVNPSNTPYVYKTDISDSMTNLGHIVHVLQDMTSIPHTRNDAHPPADFIYGVPASILGTSGYEEVTARATYMPPNTNKIEFIDETNLLTKFQQLAIETNNNFLSEDTIPDPNNKPSRWRSFGFPTIPQVTIHPVTGTVISGQLGYYPNNIQPIVLVYEDQVHKIVRYTLDTKIHTANADVLMPEAISYTAGVIKYFLSLKGDGKVIIDNPADNTTVTSSSLNISGHLTYYAASATVYYHLASNPSRNSKEIPVTLTNGQYVFDTNMTLEPGINKIEVVADNENVSAITGNLTVTYNPSNPGGGGTPPQSGGNGNNGGGTPLVYHLSPNGIPGVMSPDVGALLFSNPSSVPCILSSPYINPNANSPVKKPFNQLCGYYQEFALWEPFAPSPSAPNWLVYRVTSGREWVKYDNPYFPPQPHSAGPSGIQGAYLMWDTSNPSWSRFTYNPQTAYELNVKYGLGSSTLGNHYINCNDPCFQGMPSLPDDLFTGNGLKPGDYLDPNGNLWRKAADGNVTQI